MTDIQGPEPTPEQVADLVEEDEIDERLSDPVEAEDDEPYHEDYEVGVSDPFTDAAGQRYIHGQRVSEEDWQQYQRLLAEEAEIERDLALGAEIPTEPNPDEPVDAVALHSDAAANIAAARDVPGDYTGEVVYLYDYRDNGNLRVVDGPFRADVPFGLEIDADQTLGPLPVTLPRED